MKFIKLIIILLTVFHFSSLSASEDKLYNKIVKNLRCLVCQGQSVYDSDTEFAISLKLVVKNKIQQGLSEKQIYNFLTENMVSGFYMIQNLIKIPIYYGFYLY